MLKKTLLLAGVTYFFSTKKVYNSPQPMPSMLLRGAYENKIRRFSPPQKIFDVFATIYEKGRLYMTLRDLLKAICFYNYSLSDQKGTEGFNPPHILKFLGKDNKFEIYDYFILVRFIAFERQKIIRYFEKRGMEEISTEKFIQFMKEAVCQDYKDYIKHSLLIESRQFRPNYKEYQEKIQLISKQIFQNSGRSACKVDEIIHFRREMIKELYQFEFLMFPIQNGCIDGVDFARSIIKYVEPGKVKRFMKRINDLEMFSQIRISKQAYVGFHTYMQTNIRQLQSQLSRKGAIDTEQFAQLVNKYVGQSQRVTKDQLQVITKLLDVDNSGFVEKRQILGVLKNLEYYTKVKSGDQTFIQQIKKDFQKIKDKLIKIKEILDQ